MQMNRLHRLLLASTLVLCFASPGTAKPASTPEHIVVVVLGGGVQCADLTDKVRMPKLAALAKEGKVLRNVRAEATDGVSAIARLLTGHDAPGTELATKRAEAPTLCEYVRAGRALPAEKVWYVAFDESAALRESHSNHPSFGPAVAPRVAFGKGPIAEPLSTFLEVQGRPVPLSKDAFALLSGLRKVTAAAASARLPRDVKVGLPAFDRIERAVLAELDRKASLVRGPNPGDERAWRGAETAIRIHRPVLTVVRLGEAEIADTSTARYHGVLRANDRALGRVRARVEADGVMRGKTLFVIVPDRGRVDVDGKLLARPGPVTVVLHGPGATRFRPKGPRFVEDLAPTVGALLGVPTPDATGTAWLR